MLGLRSTPLFLSHCRTGGAHLPCSGRVAAMDEC